jgi:hypothetical protein
MIFGVQAPKIVSGSTTVNLDYAVLDPKFCVADVVEHTSPLNGDKTFILKGDYAEFKLEVDISKHEDKNTFFSQLKNLENQLVVFYPHKDEQAIKDLAGNDVLFFLTVEPFYFNNEVDQDMILLTFHSVGFIDYRGIWNIQGYGYQFAYNFGFGV